MLARRIMRNASPKLGAVQLQIMQILWDRGEATAREITEELSRTAPVALSTVQTLLRQLEAKRAVSHHKISRNFVFRPVTDYSDASHTATRDLVTRMFHGSVYRLVSHLLGSEEIDPAELAQIRELVEKKAASKA